MLNQRPASATIVVDAKKVALCTVWPSSDVSTMRSSRPSIVLIHACRTSFRRAVMLLLLPRPLHGGML